VHHRPSTSGPGPAIARRGRGGPMAGDPDRRKKPRLRDRLWARIVGALLAVFLIVTGWSVGHALTMSGGGTISERLAEWARGHYLGPLVTFGEWLSYSPPKKGGKPSFSLAAPAARAAAAKQQKDAAADKFAALYGPPAALPSLAGKPLPGEGQWRVLTSVNGKPAIYGTYLRASSVYSSYVAGIALMNQRLLTFQLRPGTEDPGPGHWKAANYITPGTRTGLEATFNSGFKINVSGGGFYLNGATSGTLAKGAATVVYYKDGHIAIGVWGQHGLGMTPDVVGVRQNLRPIVVNGKIPASVDSNVTTQWGATLGGGYYVWRSGLGITRDGRIVFVYGPSLNVREVAQLLKTAGAVTGMQLDINPDWMSYEFYKPGNHPNNPTPKNLLPTQMQPATRYYSPASRDFTAVYAR
jgi:Phosphodiester glycosidase